MAQYPITAVTFPVRQDAGIIFAQHVNAVQEEITAITQALVNGVPHVLRPDQSGQRDLGSSSLRWRDLHLSRNLLIGGNALSLGTAVDLPAVAPTYAVSWTSTGTAPDIGNGSLTGRYYRVGRLVYFSIGLSFGSTTTGGTGAWKFSLPSAVVIGVFGNSMITTAGGNDYTGLVRNVGGTTDVGIRITSASPATAVSATVPVTWTTGDGLNIRGFYID